MFMVYGLYENIGGVNAKVAFEKTLNDVKTGEEKEKRVINMTDEKTKNQPVKREEGGTLDIYHFKSRIDMLLAAAFIVIVLLVLILITLWGGESQAALF